MFCSLHHHSNSLEVNSGPLSVRITVGLPRQAITISRVLIMRLEASLQALLTGTPWSRTNSSAICRLVAGPSLLLRTGPSKARYPSPDQRTSSWGANAPLPGYLVSSHRTHPTPRIWPSIVKGGGCDALFTADDPGVYTGFMLLEGLYEWTSVNRDFFMVV